MQRGTGRRGGLLRGVGQNGRACGGPTRCARSAERGVLRIWTVPTAGNRAQKAAASRFRLIAAAGQGWVLMLPKPRRTARPSPCQERYRNPSDRQRWRSWSRRLRARSSAGWSAPISAALRLRLPETQSPLSGRPAQSLVPARKRRPSLYSRPGRSALPRGHSGMSCFASQRGLSISFLS